MPLSTALRMLAFSAAASVALTGCKTADDITGSITPTSASRQVALTPEAREAQWRRLADRYGAAYSKDPNDPAVAYAYGVALRQLGQRAQALAVLESASMRHPKERQIVAAYGRALADAGRLEAALGALANAHAPEKPDWRILNAQGAILDQLGRSAEARSYYASALKIAPGEPAILSNLGLSYALANELVKAETLAAQAAASPRADDKVRANLALIQGLKAGRGTPATLKAAAKPAA